VVDADSPLAGKTVLCCAGFADELAWLCFQLRLAQPVVVGRSMGGNIAFELARRYSALSAAVVTLDSRSSGRT
jgi:pimeloyl-ACP methyl ester carboxylesterase